MNQWYMGRRTAEKSDDGAWIYIDQKQWTLDKFQFLKGHITRLTGHNIASVNI